MNGVSRQIIVFVCIAGGAAAAGCAGSDARAVDRGINDAPIVAAVKIGRSDIVQTLNIPAEFRPFQEIDVHAKVAGFVKSITTPGSCWRRWKCPNCRTKSGKTKPP